jgi:hypothetical protein
MFDSIKLVWRNRRHIVGLIEGAERITDAALAAKPKHLELIQALDSTFFHAAMRIMTRHSIEKTEAIIRKMHNINETWDETGKSDTR